MRATVPLFLLTYQAFAASHPLPGDLVMTGPEVVTIGGQTLTLDYLRATLSQVPPKQLEMMRASGQLKEFIEQIAAAQLLYRRAIADGLHEDQLVRLQISIAERDALIKAYMGRVALKAATPAALRQEYEGNETYQQPQARVRVIVVETAEQAREISARLRAGFDFATLARTHSLDPSAPKGGDLGWIGATKATRELAEVALATSTTGLLEPAEMSRGYLVIEVLARRSAIPLEEVRDQLEAAIKQRAVKDLLEELRAQNPIQWQIDVENLEIKRFPGW